MSFEPQGRGSSEPQGSAQFRNGANSFEQPSPSRIGSEWREDEVELGAFSATGRRPPFEQRRARTVTTQILPAPDARS